ncbi:MAG: DNA-directed RNA polymerase subunit omega [Miltoncostaeaceae bacterium]
MDSSLEHVNGSRYALVHAVAKRARQITLWLTADPAELRAESAPPPAAGELVSRDPVALAEAEILDGEVAVRWDPDGQAEELELGEPEVETDPLLIEGLDDEVGDGDEDGGAVTPALAQVLEGDGAVDEAAGAEVEAAEEEADGEAEPATAQSEGDVSFEEAAEHELSEDHDDEGKTE